MGLFNKVLKKDNIPDELPDLAVDELRKDLKESSGKKEMAETTQEKPAENSETTEETTTTEATEEQPAEGEATTETAEEKPAEGEATEETTTETTEEQPAEGDDTEVVEEVVEVVEGEDEHEEESYFHDIIKNLEEDKRIISKMKELSSSNDLVSEMKKYWDKKNDKLILRALKKEFKMKINEKASALKKLEYEWREMQTTLIEKEEAIRKEEKDLKRIVKQFLDIYKEDKKDVKNHKTSKKSLKKRKTKKK